MANQFEHTQEFQKTIDGIELPRENKLEMVAMMLGVLNNKWNPEQTRLVHANEAYFIPDSSRDDAVILPLQQFGEVIVRGCVPRVSCVTLGERFVFALPFMNSVVLGPEQEIETELLDYELDGVQSVLPLHQVIPRPLYTPVESIQYGYMVA